MSNYRTTADLLDGVLRRCGELTSSQGVSPRQTSALLYINNIYQTIMSGGNELNIDVDESWAWAKERRPIIIQLNPSITAGTAAVTYGSNIVNLSNAPTDPISGSNISVADWILKTHSSPECYTVANHTAGSTVLQLDSLYSQTSSSPNYNLFQIDYDLTPSYMIIDSSNQYLDFISSSATNATTVTATIAQGSYTSLALCGAVTAALSATDSLNTYSATYDSLRRLFTVSSNLGGANPLFTIVGNGPNYALSGWNELGFDYTSQTGGSTYTGSYPLGSVIRFTSPGRVYFGSNFWGVGGGGDGQVGILDDVAFDQQYPMIAIEQGTPSYFKLLQETNTGKMKIRLNRYMPTTQAMRLEFDWIREAKDLFNNIQSIPRIPKSHRSILEYGASYYLCLDKNDSRANEYLGIAQKKLQAMMKENRRELKRAGKEFGNIIARWDLVSNRNHGRLNQYGYDLLSTN